MVWGRPRDIAVDFSVFDSIRGSDWLLTNGINTQQSNTGFSMLTTGFRMTNMSSSNMNYSGSACVSWTFRKQPKFFDVVSWTGNATNRTIAHALGSIPGSIWVKRTDANGAWQVYHRSLANTQYLVLNTTAAVATGATRWNSTTPTSSVFSLGTDATVNASGGTYVAYIFAHDAGGFGLNFTDNVISCGSYTGNGVVAGPSVTLGYEPQWVLVKSSTVAGSNWFLMDNMRGMAYTLCNELYADLSAAEVLQSKTIIPTATGFNVATNDAYINNSGSTYIYIAIRRGPMAVPTTGTSVFSPNISSGATGTAITTNFPVDFQLYKQRNAVNFSLDVDRLRGVNTTTTANSTPWLDTVASSAEVTNTGVSRNWGSTGFEVPSGAGSASYIYYSFKRAPSFFDEVCYTGTGTSTAVSHNLAAVPELMIVKARSTSGKWTVYNAPMGNTAYMFLEETTASQTNVAYWSNTTPTASNFTVNALNNVNGSGITYVAYLFATCAGVSKVGSYTGNGSTQTIDCGFGAGGARFVLIKRTDSTGGWYVYDTARGMTVLTDPYLFFNDYAAEVATLGSVTTVSTGFALNAAIVAAINTNAASYIFLAIA
jgi:hypothetical protein